jgi:Tfp pilus assembly protein PilW
MKHIIVAALVISLIVAAAASLYGARRTRATAQKSIANIEELCHARKIHLKK